MAGSPTHEELDEWVLTTLQRIARNRTVNWDDLYDAIPEEVDVGDVNDAVARLAHAGKVHEWGGGHVAYIDLLDGDGR